MNFFEWVKAFLLFYVIGIITMYVISQKFLTPIVIPGDIYYRRGPRTVYVPFASGLVIAVVIFMIFRKFAS